MIASVSGVVKALRSGGVVIEVGGVGLLVHVPARVAAGLSVGTTTSLHTTMVVREDALTLYGFESNLDREIFELLQTVTGIGPKVAQSALSVYESAELISAISHEDSAVLERIPGLGKKGAQRVVLELKEKVTGFEYLPLTPSSASWRDQLSGALVGLGFTPRESQERIDSIVGDYKDVSKESLADLLKAALAQGSRQ
jgi:Holliday junction DNA helicase RuvA